MARVRLLDLVKPFAPLVPEVQYSYQKILPFDRLAYTIAGAVLYILLAETSVWGVSSETDPISWLRAPLAMSRGTLTEFGVVPILVSGFLFQTAAGTRRLKVSLDVRSDRVLFQTAQKLCAILLTAVLAAVSAFAGGYARTGNFAIVFVQFFLGGVCIVYLDEVLSKGYGIVPGILLFSSVRVAQDIFWTALSLMNVDFPNKIGSTMFGVVPAFFTSLASRSVGFAITETAFRKNLPNTLTLALALAVFLSVVYLSLVKLDLQIRMTKVRGQSQQFPVRLLYTGPVAVLFALAVLALVITALYAASVFAPAIPVVSSVIGEWEGDVPVSGLPLLFVPQSGSVLLIPVRAAVYTLFVVVVSVWGANAWTTSSGGSPRDMAKLFKENAIVLVGKRDVSVLRELREIIPFAASLGAALAAVAASSDAWGLVSGSGATAAIAALDAFAMFEIVMQETGGGTESMMPQ